MARIRSIKPEFWADDNMLDLSDSCALFFVSLWNFCDDEGKIENKPRAISKLVCRWSEGKVKLFIKTLSTSGRLRVSIDSTWLQVENWTHQKIDRPKQPKILSSQIQWVTKKESSNDHRTIIDDSMQGEDRIGKDRKGSEVSGDARYQFEFIPEENAPRGAYAVVLPDKKKITEEIFLDERFMSDLQITHPGKNYIRAWDECWLHHSQKPSPPEHTWQWKQKFCTWLTIDKSNGITKAGNRKQQHTSKLAASVAETYRDVFTGGQNG